MRVYIVSDHDPTSAQIRQIVLREGQDCPASHVVSLDQAIDKVPQGRPDLIILVLASAMERALKVLADLRLLTPARVLAIGRSGDPRVVLQAVRAGASDIVDEAELEAELVAALSRLRTEVGGQEDIGRVIAVLAPNGGSGSSTVAVNLATLLAKEYQSACLFDLKLEAGDLSSLLDLKPSYTLADLCQNAARMDRVMFEQSLVRHASGVHLLAPPRVLADVAYITPQGVRQAVSLGRALFPYVIADLDHTFREEQVQVLRLADVILLVLRLDFAALRNARRTLDYLAQLGISSERVRVVVNRYGQPREVPADKAEGALGLKIAHYIPDEPKTVNRCNNNGVPAVLEFPRARVCKSMAQLAHSVNGRHPAKK
jgi:pilus assembly protein CpaE